MPLRPQAAGIAALAAGLLAAVGCVSPQVLPEHAATVVELAATPFFPQEELQCGPASLASVLGASGVPTTPAELEPRLFIPGRKGSLQVEMQAAPRAFGRLAYQIDPELDSIVDELHAGRPVLVLHNYGLPLWPRWHYAVVVGHDGPADRVMMRSGTRFRDAWSTGNFMRAWDNGGRWALVMLKPGELPVTADSARYLEMAAAFEKVADPAQSEQAFAAATRAWPSVSAAWIGLGNAQYRQTHLQEARTSYATALDRDAGLLAARNNLAMTLIELGCPRSAERLLQGIQAETVAEPMRAALLDTQSRLGAGPDAASCR